MSNLRNQLFSRPYCLADNQLTDLREWVREGAFWLSPTYLLPCLLFMISLLAILIWFGQKAQPLAGSELDGRFHVVPGANNADNNA